MRRDGARPLLRFRDQIKAGAMLRLKDRPGAFRTYAVLVAHANIRGEAEVSAPTIARLTGRTRKAIYKDVQILQEEQLIEVCRRKGRKTKNIYTIVPPTTGTTDRNRVVPTMGTTESPQEGVVPMTAPEVVPMVTRGSPHDGPEVVPTMGTRRGIKEALEEGKEKREEHPPSPSQRPEPDQEPEAASEPSASRTYTLHRGDNAMNREPSPQERDRNYLSAAMLRDRFSGLSKRTVEQWVEQFQGEYERADVIAAYQVIHGGPDAH